MTLPRGVEKGKRRRRVNIGWMLVAFSLLVTIAVRTDAQSNGRSSQRANESDRVMVSRSVTKADEESPHARKGKKGLSATTAKRAEPQPATAKGRGNSTATQAARKAPSRTPNSSRIETPSSAKAEIPRAEEPVPAPPPVLAASDRIEVVEWGAKPSSTAAQPLPTPAPLKPGSSTRRYEVEMDPGRIQQIQQALISRGFLAGEPTSIYDDATIEAMRQFQISQKIDATGYPTAHALKRLGL